MKRWAYAKDQIPQNETIGIWIERAFDFGMSYQCNKCMAYSRFPEDICPNCKIKMSDKVIDGDE